MNIDKNTYLSNSFTESQAKEFAEERFTDFDDKFYTSVLKFKMWVSENIGILVRISSITLLIVFAVFVHGESETLETLIPDSLSYLFHCFTVFVVIWGFTVAIVDTWLIFADSCRDKPHDISLRITEIILSLILAITYTIIKF